MMLPRRDFLVLAGAAVTPLALPWSPTKTTQGRPTMYGLIGKVLTVAGQRDAFAAVLGFEKLQSAEQGGFRFLPGPITT